MFNVKQNLQKLTFNFFVNQISIKDDKYNADNENDGKVSIC